MEARKDNQGYLRSRLLVGEGSDGDGLNGHGGEGGYRDGMDRKKEGGEGKLEGYGREDIETSGGEAHRQLKREKQGEEKEQGEGRGKEWKGSRRDTSGEEVNIDWQLASTLRVFAQRQDPTRRGPCQHDDFRPELHSIPPSRYTVHYDTRAADTWEKPAILAAIPDPLGIHPAVLHCNWGLPLSMLASCTLGFFGKSFLGPFPRSDTFGYNPNNCPR